MAFLFPPSRASHKRKHPFVFDDSNGDGKTVVGIPSQAAPGTTPVEGETPPGEDILDDVNPEAPQGDEAAAAAAAIPLGEGLGTVEDVMSPPFKKRRLSVDYIRAYADAGPSIFQTGRSSNATARVLLADDENCQTMTSEVTIRLEDYRPRADVPLDHFLAFVAQRLIEQDFLLLASLEPHYKSICRAQSWSSTRVADYLVKYLPVRLWRASSRAGWLVLRRDLNPYAYLHHLAGRGPTAPISREQMQLLLLMMPTEAIDVIKFILFALLGLDEAKRRYGWSDADAVRDNVHAMEVQLTSRVREYLASDHTANETHQYHQIRKIARRVVSPARTNRRGGIPSMPLSADDADLDVEMEAEETLAAAAVAAAASSGTTTTTTVSSGHPTVVSMLEASPLSGLSQATASPPPAMTTTDATEPTVTERA